MWWRLTRVLALWRRSDYGSVFLRCCAASLAAWCPRFRASDLVPCSRGRNFWCPLPWFLQVYEFGNFYIKFRVIRYTVEAALHFVCSLYLTTLLVTETQWRWWQGELRVMDWKGFGRWQLWPSRGITSAFAWRDWWTEKEISQYKL